MQKHQIEDRLAVLKQEYEKGRAEMEKLDKQRAYLKETMLRLSGAIQVLEELVADTEAFATKTPDPDQVAAFTDEKKQEMPA